MSVGSKIKLSLYGQNFEWALNVVFENDGPLSKKVNKLHGLVQLALATAFLMNIACKQMLLSVLMFTLLLYDQCFDIIT